MRIDAATRRAMAEKARAVKRAAAEAALDYVKPGMVLGLGSGSTAEIFVELLGARVAKGLDVTGIPTSENTARAARLAGVPLIVPEQTARIDLAVDGTDEVDSQFRLIKGGGGCLLREKIVASSADHMVVIADVSKQVAKLGAFPLPVEVDRFGLPFTAEKVVTGLQRSGCHGFVVKLRMMRNGQVPFVTDGGNYILDCECKVIPDPDLTAFVLAGLPGVVEHGLFLGLAHTVILADENGARTLDRPKA